MSLATPRRSLPRLGVRHAYLGQKVKGERDMSNEDHFVTECVQEWRDTGENVSEAVAQVIASWWHSPGTHGRALSAFSHTGTVTSELLDSIDREAGLIVRALTRAFGSGGHVDDMPDNLNALYALRAYVKAIPHADYPHHPGTLYDCPACERECYCADMGAGMECTPYHG